MTVRLAALVTAFAASLAAVGAAAQAPFPDKPIRLIVPFATGGVTDTSGRVIAEGLTKRLGQQVFVDNRPGASGNTGTQQGAAAAPDGYTLVLAFDGTMVINPHVFPSVPFDTLKDFAPIGKIGDATLILVAWPGFPGKTVKDVVEMSKKDPKGLSYGTSGVGGSPHLAGELFALRTGAKLVHVPYKGGGPAITDALGGNIPLVFTAVAGAGGHVKSGKLAPIAVASRQRSASLPDVPTFIESGVPDFDVTSWVGILAPAKTPPAVVERLNRELNAVLTSPETVEKLAGLGIVATPGSPDQFGEQMKTDLAKYGVVVKAANIRLE